MGATEVRDHWEQRWDQHAHEQMGWFQSEPEPSLELVTSHTPTGGSVLDVGGGASRLVDRLLGRGYRPTVLDIAEPALAAARARLGERADRADRAVVHTKPSGDEQAFTFVVLHRRDGGQPGAAAGR